MGVLAAASCYVNVINTGLHVRLPFRVQLIDARQTLKREMPPVLERSLDLYGKNASKSRLSADDCAMHAGDN